MGVRVKTLGLLTLLTVLLVVIGYVIGVFLGVPIIYTLSIGFGLAMGINVLTYWYSHKWILKMHKAR